ncbi:MAG: hypothetical protein AB2801_18085 [Candidatus Thiodiazotropha endolucinida]
MILKSFFSKIVSNMVAFRARLKSLVSKVAFKLVDLYARFNKRIRIEVSWFFDWSRGKLHCFYRWVLKGWSIFSKKVVAFRARLKSLALKVASKLVDLYARFNKRIRIEASWFFDWSRGKLHCFYRWVLLKGWPTFNKKVVAFRVRLSDLARTRAGWFFHGARQTVHVSHK